MKTRHEEIVESIGKLVNSPDVKDAVHVPVISIVAGQDLLPGHHIRILDRRAYEANKFFPIIVDPFLTQPVKKGEVFWAFLQPGRISDLVHDWKSNYIPDNERVHNQRMIEESRKWLKEHAQKLGLTFKDLMHAADRWADNEDVTVIKDEVPALDIDWFWYHYEIYSGKFIPRDKRVNFFSCAC